MVGRPALEAVLSANPKDVPAPFVDPPECPSADVIRPVERCRGNRRKRRNNCVNRNGSPGRGGHLLKEATIGDCICEMGRFDYNCQGVWSGLV